MTTTPMAASVQLRRGSGIAQAGRWSLPLISVLSLWAAAVHFSVAPQHFEEWWGYGVFFVVSGSLQALFPLLLLPARTRSKVAILGIAANLAVIATWAASRLTTLPVGPHGGHSEREAVGTLDFTTTLVEVALVILLASSLRGRTRAATVNALAFAGLVLVVVRFLT